MWEMRFPTLKNWEINFPCSLFFFFSLRQNWDLSRGSQRTHLTFTAGWSEVVHQEAKEVVELQKKREKTIILKEKNVFCPFFLNKKNIDSVFDDVDELTTLNRECKWWSVCLKTPILRMQPHVMLQRTLTDTSPSLFCPLSNIWKGQQSFNSELKQLLAVNRGLTKSIGDFFFFFKGSGRKPNNVAQKLSSQIPQERGLTLIWSCSPAYSIDWKMFHVHLRLISSRATYWRYQRWISRAALMAGKKSMWQQLLYTTAITLFIQGVMLCLVSHRTHQWQLHTMHSKAGWQRLKRWKQFLTKTFQRKSARLGNGVYLGPRCSLQMRNHKGNKRALLGWRGIFRQHHLTFPCHSHTFVTFAQLQFGFSQAASHDPLLFSLAKDKDAFM